MKRILATILFSMSSWSALAAGGGMALLDARVDLSDAPSLQRGAKLYVNYCLGCHSLDYMRYNRLGKDLGIGDEQLAENLLFSASKITEPMSIATKDADAENWFGVAPPDLSVIARSRGPDWLYSYLVSFYADSNPARLFGVNNVVFKDAGMPHVMLGLQGTQAYVKGEVPDGVENLAPYRLESAGNDLLVHTMGTKEDGSHVKVVDRLTTVVAGEMEPGEFRKAMRDLVNFLAYAGEPAQLIRYKVGMWVLLFLAGFFFLTRALYKEYWRDVH